MLVHKIARCILYVVGFRPLLSYVDRKSPGLNLMLDSVFFTPAGHSSTRFLLLLILV